MNQGLRKRFPDLLIEAALVFFAVAVALAAEEWREDRERRELADRALQGVLYEIGENRATLQESQETNREALAGLMSALQVIEEGSEPERLSLDYEVALISTAAWETARMSQAIHFLEFDVMSSLAELYELQAWFERTQDDLVDRVSNMGAGLRDGDYAPLRELSGRLTAVLGYRDILIQAFDSTLATLDLSEP